MKKICKKFNLILAVIMVITLLSACSQPQSVDIATNEELDPAKIGDYSTLKLPIDDKYTEISYLHDSDITNLNDSLFIKELRRRTGLNINVIAVPLSTIAEKAKVLMASKDEMPDIMDHVGGIDEVNDFGKQGAFEEILQHIDELPNFKKLFYDEADKYDTKGKIKNFLDGEGNLFMFPRYNISRKVNHGFLYRKDIFDKHGIKMWTSTEEFLDVLRQLKKLYPDSTPFASKTGDQIFGNFTLNYGLDIMTGFQPYYDEEEKVWKMSCTDPKFKDCLDLVKTMFDEGLIDPEFITATQPAWTAKMTQADKAFVTWDWIGRLDMFKEQTLQTVPDYDLRYAEPLEGKVITLTNVLTGPAVKKGKNSMLALKLLDYMIKTYNDFEPHTIWEAYSPTEYKPATDPYRTGTFARSDFCGWSALGPISVFIEYILGFYKIDAFEKKICWEKPDDYQGKIGIENLRFGNIVTDIIWDGEKYIVKSNEPYTLEINGKVYDVVSGNNHF